MMGAISAGLTQDGIDALVKLLSDAPAAERRIKELTLAAKTAWDNQDQAEKNAKIAEAALARLEKTRGELNDAQEQAQAIAKSNAEKSLQLVRLEDDLRAREAAFAGLAKQLDERETVMRADIASQNEQLHKAVAQKEEDCRKRMKAAAELESAAQRLMSDAQKLKAEAERRLAAMRQVVA